MRVARVWFTRGALVAAAAVGLATLGGSAAAARPAVAAVPPVAVTPPTQAASKPAFKVTISPRYTTAGSRTTFEVTIKNTSPAGTTLRSVQVAPPTGFTVAQPVATAPLRNKTRVHKRMTTVHSLALRPGNTKEFPVTATAPTPTNCGTRTLERWTSQAFQGSTPTGVQLALQQAQSSVGVIVVCPQAAPCGDGGPTCSTPEPTNVSNYVASSDAGSGTLLSGLDVGNRLKCPGYTSKDPNWYDSVLSGGPTSVSYQIQYTLRGPPSNQVRICFGLPYEFTTASGSNARSARLPNGNAGFVGLLPACPAAPAAPTGPCVLSLAPSDPNTNTGADATVLVPAPPPTGTPAGDPWFGG